MDHREKLKGYRGVFKDPELLKFVDFLDSLFDWMDTLYESRCLSPEHRHELDPYLPRKIFDELDAHVDSEVTSSAIGTLKDVLLEEGLKLIKKTIDIGRIQMVDFDLLQFNLYQIFGKEQLASMIEGARLYLGEVDRKKKTEVLRRIEAKKKEEQAWRFKLSKMSDKEMNKLIIDSMFDFTHSARSPQERIEAVKRNKNNLFQLRHKFRKFETKLMDATTGAREDAQSNVYKQIGQVSRHMDEVSQNFRDKAKEFSSDEGPKKLIGRARKVIMTEKKKLHEQLKDKGGKWEARFREEIHKAQHKIKHGQRVLDIAMVRKGKEWEVHFGAKAKKAQEEILRHKVQLSGAQKREKDFIAVMGTSALEGAKARITKGAFDFKGDIARATQLFAGKGEAILNLGKKGIDKARMHVQTEKSEFEEDVGRAHERFSGKGKEIDEARDAFIKKSAIAADAFTQRGEEVEGEMYGTLYHEQRRFELEIDTAKAKFEKKAAEIGSQAKAYIGGKRQQFMEDRDKAGGRFLTKAGSIKGTPTKEKVQGSHGEQLTVKAEEAKSKIDVQHKGMIEKATQDREKMIEKIKYRRDLFLYDARFARHKMQERSREFAEEVEAKQEEFIERGKQVTARHKAKQKSHLIRNLLRTIRGMH